MNCQKCKSERIASIYGKCNDLTQVSVDEHEHVGYFPHDLGLGGGDDIQFDVCLDCGQVKGEWPLPLSELESKTKEFSEESE